MFHSLKDFWTARKKSSFHGVLSIFADIHSMVTGYLLCLCGGVGLTQRDLGTSHVLKLVLSADCSFWTLVCSSACLYWMIDMCKLGSAGWRLHNVFNTSDCYSTYLWWWCECDAPLSVLYRLLPLGARPSSPKQMYRKTHSKAVSCSQGFYYCFSWNGIKRLLWATCSMSLVRFSFYPIIYGQFVGWQPFADIISCCVTSAGPIISEEAMAFAPAGNRNVNFWGSSWYCWLWPLL